MPILPISRSQTSGSRRKLSGKRVSSGDVSITPPGVSRVRNLNVPKGAFETTLGVGAEEVGPALFEAGQRIQIAEVESQKRDDTVSRADATNTLEEEIAAESARVNDKEDPSLKEIGEGFGSFMSDAEQRLIEEHIASGASADSVAKLKARLGDVVSAGTGTMAGLVASAKEAKARASFKKAISKLGVDVSRDTSARNIDLQREKLIQAVEDHKDSFSIGEEQKMLDAGNEHISMTVANKLLGEDKPELLDAHLSNPAFRNSISREALEGLFKRMVTVRTSKNKLIEEKRQLEVLLGRTLTPKETTDHFLKSPTALRETEKDKERKNLRDRNFDEDTIEDIVNDQIDIKGPDEFGNYVSTNKTTGKVIQLGPAESAAITEAITKKGPPPETTAPTTKPTKGSLEGAILQGTGPFAKIQAGLSNVFGPFMEGAIFKETTDARQQIKIFAQVGKTALVNNPKFPVAEQKIVQELLPDPSIFFQDPDTARNDMIVLRKTLQGFQEAKLKELTTAKRITSVKRGELADQISSINEILSMMETTEAEKLPDGIPQGSELIGESKRGNPVWITPEGKQFEVLPEKKAPSTKKDSKKITILKDELAKEVQLLLENPADSELHQRNIAALEKEIG